ncbi:VanZ family protein [Tepidibacillus fermentans]|uniref:VanZ like protein n=1 Tax=Tepidibacillus fermentans TaxID=1281767 RepID=A0A4R3KI68_9BACI|nr:VanZ family protein [Tepidibacillus fermentans]TCS83213.1 VanZ like protein [Tepidibacillus fermentans]
MKKWIPSIFVMIGIFYLSSRTGSELNQMFPFFKDLNWGHLVAYFILAMTFIYALIGKFPLIKSMVVAVVLSVIYGLTDEWHQMYVPGRTPDIHDLVNDFIGAIVGVIVFYFWVRKKESKE